MKVYVNELPNSCADCEWFTPNHCSKDGRNFCLIARMPFYNTEEDRKITRGQHKDSLSDFECPLQSLADHDKQTIKDFTQSVKGALIDKIKLMKNEEHCYLQKVVKWEDIIYILNKLSV